MVARMKKKQEGKVEAEEKKEAMILLAEKKDRQAVRAAQAEAESQVRSAQVKKDAMIAKSAANVHTAEMKAWVDEMRELMSQVEVCNVAYTALTATCTNGVVAAGATTCTCSAGFTGGGAWVSGSLYPACTASR